MNKIEKCRKELREYQALRTMVMENIKRSSYQIIKVWKDKVLPFQEKLYEEDHDLYEVLCSDAFKDNEIMLCQDCTIKIRDSYNDYHSLCHIDVDYDAKTLVSVFGKYMINDKVADEFLERCRNLMDRRLSAYLDEIGTRKRQWKEALDEVEALVGQGE